MRVALVVKRGPGATGTSRYAEWLRRELGPAAPPDPERGDWSEWRALLADRDHGPEDGPGAAMSIALESGFGTVSSALIALPAPKLPPRKPVFLFAAGRPGDAPYEPVAL